MKRLGALTATLMMALHLPALAQQPITVQSHTEHSLIEHSQEERAAHDWGLRLDEWTRYKELMAGPLGVYSPNLDPLSALGTEARSDDERQRYAELQVEAEAKRIEKLLAYQRAYDQAWQRLHPDSQRVNLPQASPVEATARGNGRTAVFVRDRCPPCDQAVQRLQASRTDFDVYLVGSRGDDARIRQWAQRARIDASRVSTRTITLNHDAGRWLSLGLPGELPAIVRQVNGQWLRQP